MAERTVLDVQSVSKRFGGLLAVDQLSFSVREHEVLGLIGPNGSGKTTLLRLLTNLHTPASGTVSYAGRSAAEIGERELARQIAYLAQGGDVHWPMRVDAVVSLSTRAEVSS